MLKSIFESSNQILILWIVFFCFCGCGGFGSNRWFFADKLLCILYHIFSPTV